MPDAAFGQALALYQAQDLIGAHALLENAQVREPADARTAFLSAQVRYELGLPAADAFAQAARLWPGNAEITRNHALALQAEGRFADARELLEAELDRDPRWLAGHHALAAMLWTLGEADAHLRRLAEAARAERSDPALWLGWFQLLAQARDWDAARAVLDEAEAALGGGDAIAASRLFLACESGDHAEAEDRLVRTAHLHGDGIALCRIRHALRSGDARRAEAIALPLAGTPSAATFWPYLSLCWRLLDDPRAEWLDRPAALIASHDDLLDSGELAQLADLLRGLHTGKAPYLEQSVRGGTQTDRSLLLRGEPALQRLRARLMAAIREYIDHLPAPAPGHPLLSAPRSGALRIEGSWSVRLAAQGHNVPHTHPRGWLSTAFYVALPDGAVMGAAPAGHIAFGAPPPELGLGLPPVLTVAPQAGRMVIFPSTSWHSTVPFSDGERLVVAFDVTVQRERT